MRKHQRNATLLGMEFEDYKKRYWPEKSGNVSDAEWDKIKKEHKDQLDALLLRRYLIMVNERRSNAFR